MATETELRRVCLKCVDFCRQITYHRQMASHMRNMRNNYFIYSFNNFIDLAVLDFCHLFGSYSDDLHWRKFVKNSTEFKENLLNELNFTEKQWEEYWKCVKDYRDKDVAHLEIRPKSDVPDMSTATKAIIFYYNHIIQELKAFKNYDMFMNDLSAYIKQLEELSGKFIQKNIFPLFEFVDAT